MPLNETRISQPRCSPQETIPYSSAALRQDLERLRGVWEDCQASRDRNAIYGYLTAVYGLVAWWAADGREIERARRALRLQRLEVSEREDPLAAIIRCTTDPAKADKRTRSKWSRVMRYASAYKPDSEPLDQFIQRKGGINACSARFSRWVGPLMPTRYDLRSGQVMMGAHIVDFFGVASDACGRAPRSSQMFLSDLVENLSADIHARRRQR